MEFKNSHFKQLLIREIDSCIRNNAKDFSKLEEHEQDEILSLTFKALGNQASEYLNDALDFEELTCSFINTLDMSDYSKSLAKVMRANTVSYFTKSLNKIFDERINSVEFEDKIESGLRPFYHKDNNELHWGR